MISVSSIASVFMTCFFPISFLLIAVFLILFVALPYKRVQSYKGDGVTTYFFPVLGFFRFLRQSQKSKHDIMGSLKEASKSQKHPKYLVVNAGRKVIIMLQDPKYIKEFLAKPNNYQKGLVVDLLRPLVGNGLVSSEGDTWKRHRRVISSSFNFDFLRTNMPVIQNTTKEFLDKLTLEECKDYSVISHIQDITGEIVGRIFFGEHLNGYTFEDKPLTLALAELTSELALLRQDPLVILSGTSILKSPLTKYQRIMQRVKNFRQVCLSIINDRKSKPHSDTVDLLASLLATQKSEDIESRFSDEDIVDEFVTFFIAGMDTTGHLIGMTLYNLTQYPQYIDQLKIEREITYNKESQINTDTLSKMELLHSVLKETLRFYTPAPFVFVRQILTDHNILDLKVKKGDLISCAFLTSANDESHFESATQFNPGRWMNSESKADPYAFVPFSAGPRNCIGQHLALIEAKVIVSEFLERFEFKMKDGYQLEMTARFLYEPEKELFFTLQPKAK